MFAIRQPRVKLMPRMQSLPGPNPESGRDAHYERHEIFYHVDREIRGHAWSVVSRTGDRQRPAVLT